jgi:N-acetylmuramoyl-L-alanine amidase
LSGQVVALDPAHGFPTDQNEAMQKESRFARLLAHRIADSLSARGIRSVITAPDSTDPGTTARVETAMNAGATVAIVIHSEAPGILAPGTLGTVFADTSAAETRRILGRIRPGLEQVLGAPVRLDATAQLVALRRFRVPTLLLKPGNNADADTMSRLSSDPALGELAGVIARAFE